MANGLVAVGVTPGDRVTLYGPNSWEWVVGYYAVAKTGAVVNPISSMLTPDEVRYVLADSGARVLIASADKGREACRDARQEPCELCGREDALLLGDQFWQLAVRAEVVGDDAVADGPLEDSVQHHGWFTTLGGDRPDLTALLIQGCTVEGRICAIGMSPTKGRKCLSR